MMAAITIVEEKVDTVGIVEIGIMVKENAMAIEIVGTNGADMKIAHLVCTTSLCLLCCWSW